MPFPRKSADKRRYPTKLDDLITRWEQQLEYAERIGAMVPLALVVREVLADLQSLRCSDEANVVTLAEASEVGGYSVDRLQHLVASGEIENVGKKGAPRIRRSDVPMKPGRSLRTSKDNIQLSPRRRIVLDARNRHTGSA